MMPLHMPGPGSFQKAARCHIRSGPVEVTPNVDKAIRRLMLRDFKPDEFAVRSMLMVNDQPDSYESQFVDRALRQVSKLAAGRPLSVGHQWDVAPIARMAAAQVVKDKRDWTWVRSWFYWPTTTPEGVHMREMIDAGVWNEVSAAWWMDSATCSICGKEMPRGPFADSVCDHVPGQEYDGKRCVVLMDQVRGVLETSIVLMGAQQQTEIQAAASAHAHAAAVDANVWPQSLEQWVQSRAGGRAPAAVAATEAPETFEEWFARR